MDDKLFYDTHAKNVIVKCRNNKDLESLIKDGELGNSKPDPSKMIKILFLSTLANLDTLEDTLYVWEPIGKISLNIGGVDTPLYAYFRKAGGEKNTIPSGTVVVTDFYNVSTVATSLGGDWEELGKLYFDTDDNTTLEFYAYKKS